MKVKIRLNSIRTKSIGITLLLTLVLTAALIYTNVISMSISSKTKAEEHVATLMRILASQMDAAILFNDPSALEAKSQFLINLPYVDSVCIKNVNGELVYGSKKSCKVQQFIKNTSHLKKEIVLEVGSLTVFIDSEVIEREALEEILKTITIYAIFLGINIFYIFYTQRTITSPLIEVAEAVSSYDITESKPINLKKVTSDEVGDVVDALNSMTSTLNGQKKIIDEYNKGLERMVDERTISLRKTAENLKSFTHSVSHDLTSPLRHAEGYLYLAIEDERLPEDLKMLLEQTQESHARMFELIDSFLALSEAVNVRMTRTHVDLSLIAQEIALNAMKAAPGVYVEMICSRSLNVFANQSLMRIMLNNLISNSVKYRRLTTRVNIVFGSYISNEGETIFFLKDDGIGIDAEKPNEIFKSFERMNYKSEGYGVGLATVQRVIERHNGRIWVESNKEEGCTFLFVIGQENENLTQ